MGDGHSLYKLSLVYSISFLWIPTNCLARKHYMNIAPSSRAALYDFQYHASGYGAPLFLRAITLLSKGLAKPLGFQNSP
jgi:hypothetical protein